MLKKQLDEIQADYIGIYKEGDCRKVLDFIRGNGTQIKEIRDLGFANYSVFYMALEREITKGSRVKIAKSYDLFGWAKCRANSNEENIKVIQIYTKNAISLGGPETPKFYHGVRNEFSKVQGLEKPIEIITGHYFEKETIPYPFVMVSVSDNRF